MMQRLAHLAIVAGAVIVVSCSPPRVEPPPAPPTPVGDGSGDVPAAPDDDLANQMPDLNVPAEPGEPVAEGSAEPTAPTGAGAAPLAGPPTGARALPGTAWEPASDGTQWTRLEFTERFLTATDAAGRSLTMPADYSSTHSACLGYTGCVVTTTPDHQVVTWPFATQEDFLFHVDCRALSELASEGLTPEELSTQLGGAIVAQTHSGICFNPGLVPYTQVAR